MDPTVARAAYGSMPSTASGAPSTDTGVSEFDSFIHADLCAGVTGAPDVGANQFGFIQPFALNSTMPLIKPPASTQDLASLTLDWAGSPGAHTTATTGAPTNSTSSVSSAASTGASEPYAFQNSPIWASSAATERSLHESVDRTAFSGLPTKPDPDAPPLALLLKDENAGKSLYRTSPDDKRRKLGHPVVHPGVETRPRAVTMPEIGKRGSPDAADLQHTARKPQSGARRPPPSASQMTEAGQPFPVIDTSAKHSSLFIPPDTSGLTKREARLVKNRAAAFLSRQRKREQFEELSGKCRHLARLAWLLYESLLDTARYAPNNTSPAGVPSGAERVLNATPLGAQLRHESDDVRAVFQQLVSQQGAILLDSHYDHHDTFAPKPAAANQGASVASASDDVHAQLARARAEAAQAQKDAEQARSESAALRAHLQQQAGEVAPPSAAPSAAPQAEKPAAAPTAVHTAETCPNAMALFVLLGMALVRRASSAIPTDLLQELHGAGQAPLHELLAGADEQHKGLVQLRVSRRENEAVLCTLTAEPEAERALSATPDHAHADGSSDTSMPSLSSASPTLSSLSSSSTSARRMRRVLALCAGTQGDAQRVAYLDADLLRNLQAHHLDAWAAEFAAPLLARKDVELPTEAVDRLMVQLHGADLQSRFLLVASLEDEGAPVHLVLYARRMPAAEAAAPAPAAAARAAAALKNVVHSLSTDGDVAEHASVVLPPADAAKPAEERPPSLFQVTFRP
ncbi:hypothetical protein MBRA1_002558 [Malassezia brasiliensis]|uniref:BZIP domain-containing protein n=1 Tax=Malassezia brasiliensis TaxID=1821822 RepID=A0AAF0DUX1_9BASI|nr:hypothetical protein MBRA1_002558 [Malassezia brasiliensis]